MADKVRVNLYIPREIIADVDRLSEKFGANRSVMISMMLQSYLDQQKVLDMSKWVDEVNSKLNLERESE